MSKKSEIQIEMLRWFKQNNAVASEDLLNEKWLTHYNAAEISEENKVLHNDSRKVQGARFGSLYDAGLLERRREKVCLPGRARRGFEYRLSGKGDQALGEGFVSFLTGPTLKDMIEAAILKNPKGIGSWTERQWRSHLGVTEPCHNPILSLVKDGVFEDLGGWPLKQYKLIDLPENYLDDSCPPSKPIARESRKDKKQLSFVDEETLLRDFSKLSADALLGLDTDIENMKALTKDLPEDQLLSLLESYENACLLRGREEEEERRNQILKAFQNAKEDLQRKLKRDA